MSKRAKHTKRPYLMSEQRRQAILDAAHSLFLSKGYAAVSVEEIVRASGGSKSTVYQLFGGKKGLLAAVTESLAAKMLSEMRNDGMSIRDSLNAIGLKLIRLILSEDAITQYRLAINNLTVDPSLSRLWYTHGPEITFRGFARYRHVPWNADLQGQHRDVHRRRRPDTETDEADRFRGSGHLHQRLRYLSHIVLLRMHYPFNPCQGPPISSNSWEPSAKKRPPPFSMRSLIPHSSVLVRQIKSTITCRIGLCKKPKRDMR
jgi:AcrR family transcriptional regulator